MRQPASPEIQKVITETTGEAMTRAIAMSIDEGEIDNIATMKKEGHTFTDLPAEETDRWATILTPVMKDAWLMETENSSVTNKEALFSKAQEIMKKYEERYGRGATPKQ